jgi:membrane protein DedA with SNARE-associated domain
MLIPAGVCYMPRGGFIGISRLVGEFWNGLLIGLGNTLGEQREMIPLNL